MKETVQTIIQTQEAQQPQLKSSKRKWLFILLGMVLLLVIGASSYVLHVSNTKMSVNNQSSFESKQNSTVTIKSSQTSNWLLFSTKDFSFKYPSDANVTNSLSSQVVNKGQANGFYIAPIVNNAGVPQWYDIQLFAVKNISQSTTSDYLKTITGYDTSTLKLYKNGVINGYSFVMKQNSYPTYIVIELKNHILYVFQVTGQFGTNLTDYSKSMLDKVISTVSLSGDTSPDPKISDLLQFTIPNGWQQKISANSVPGYAGAIDIITPDLVPNCCGGPKVNAVDIRFEVTYDGKTQTPDRVYQDTYNEIHDPNPGGAVSHDLTKTTVAGFPAVSYYYDFEGHTHTIKVWNGAYLWKITIYASNSDDEIQYQAEINSVLSSIKFTNNNTSDTGNWKTYTNVKYGYYVNYPSTLEVTNLDGRAVNVETSSSVIFDYPNPTFGIAPYNIYVINQPAGTTGSLSQPTLDKVFALKVGEELDKKTTQDIDSFGSLTNYKRLPDEKVNSETFLVLDNTGGYGGSNRILFLRRKGKIYTTGTTYQKVEQLNEFKQFYSSLKFTN